MERTAISTIVKGGTIVTATDKFVADILIENGTITTIATSIPGTGPDVVDASGSYVFPGFIDPHTHMEMPFMGAVASEDFYTGTGSNASRGAGRCHVLREQFAYSPFKECFSFSCSSSFQE